MSRKVVAVQGVAAPLAHYSHAVVSEGMLYVAGQVPIDESGNVVQGDAAAQARQVLTNLSRVVQSAGASLHEVVKTTVFLTDMADRAAVGAVRKDFFSDPPPANTLVGVAALADPAFLVEVEAVVDLSGTQ